MSGPNGRAHLTTWWARKRNKIPPEAEARAKEQARLLVKIMDTTKIRSAYV